MAIIEKFGERIELLESELMDRPAKEHLEQINRYKREINFLRKTIRPTRELASHFKRSDSALITDATLPYLNDLEDQIIAMNPHAGILQSPVFGHNRTELILQ